MLRAGYRNVAGLDEAGRGAWAGPVVAAAVILPLDDPALSERLLGVRDSKLCTPHQRDALYERVRQVAVSWAVGAVPASRIDRIGIVCAVREAMGQALARLDLLADALIIDALHLPSVQLPQRSIVKADRKCLSVAAASIVAKVTRDREMIALDEGYPGYGLAQHKGYGTSLHQLALQRMGPSNTHRWSFAPIAAMVSGRGKAD